MSLLLLFHGDPSAPINATADITLGALTVSSNATLKIQGTAAITLGALTSSSQATIKIQATANITLGALTAASSSTLKIQATAAITLGALTVSSDADLKISGTLSVTLGTLLLSSTAALAIHATADITFGALTVAAAAQLAIHATADITLGALTLEASNLRERPYWFSTGRFRSPTGLGTVSAGKEETAVRIEFYSPDRPSNAYRFALPAYWTKDDGSVPSEFPLPNAYTCKGLSMMIDREDNGTWETEVLFDSSSPVTVDPAVDDVGPILDPVIFGHDIPPNCHCMVTIRLSAATGAFVPVAIRNRTGTLEIAKIDATDAPLTNTGALTGSDGRFGGEMFCPAFGISQFELDGMPVFLVSGNSIGWGKNENENVLIDTRYGGMGFIARGLEDDTRSNRFPFANFCIPGMGPGELDVVAGWPRKLAHVQRCPNRPYNAIITEHYNNLGGTYAQYKQSLLDYHAILKSESAHWGDPEAPMYQTGVIPRPGSTDWCTSLEGQGTSAGDVWPTGNRWLYDRDLRLGGIYPDIDEIIEINPYIAADLGDNRDILRLPGYVTTLAEQALSGTTQIRVLTRPADDIEYVVLDPTGSVQARHITGRAMQADGTVILTLESAINFTYAAGTVVKSSFGGDAVGLHPNTPGHKLLAGGVIDWKNRHWPFVINAGGHSEEDARRARANRAKWKRQDAETERQWRERKEREALEFFAKRMDEEGITLDAMLGVDYHELGLEDDEDVIELILLNS